MIIDTQRLDWLGRHDVHPCLSEDGDGSPIWVLFLEWDRDSAIEPTEIDKDGRRFFEPSGPTLRAAIDAGMKITGEGPD